MSRRESPSERDRLKLAAILQDAYHYFDSVLGSGNFSYKGLKGKIGLYEAGHVALHDAINFALDMEHDLPREYDRLPKDEDEIDTEAELQNEAKRGRRYAEALARHFRIDAYSGEVKE